MNAGPGWQKLICDSPVLVLPGNMENRMAAHFTSDDTDFNNRSEAEMAVGKFHGEYYCFLTD